MASRLRPRVTLALSLLLVVLVTAGCGLTVPADSRGTVERATDGVLRVGVTDNPPWVVLDSPAEPAGTEPTLIEEFAKSLNATVEWTESSESVLVDALERGELDIVVGGFLDDTLWSDKAGVTRPYAESQGPTGTQKHSMLVRMGENDLLARLETFLDQRVHQ